MKSSRLDLEVDVNVMFVGVVLEDVRAVHDGGVLLCKCSPLGLLLLHTGLVLKESSARLCIPGGFFTGSEDLEPSNPQVAEAGETMDSTGLDLVLD